MKEETLNKIFDFINGIFDMLMFVCLIAATVMWFLGLWLNYGILGIFVGLTPVGIFVLIKYFIGEIFRRGW